MNRTEKQQAGIEVYCREMAEGLNNTEASVQMVCKLPIAWTQDNFKELIWKPVQQAMYPDKTSTTQLDTAEVSEVHRQVDKIISEQWNVSHAFPSYFNENDDG